MNIPIYQKNPAVFSPIMQMAWGSSPEKFEKLEVRKRNFSTSEETMDESSVNTIWSDIVIALDYQSIGGHVSP